MLYFWNGIQTKIDHCLQINCFKELEVIIEA
jgi:hypothetical protein